MSRPYFRPEPSFQGSVPQQVSQQDFYPQAQQAYYPSEQGYGNSYPYGPQSRSQQELSGRGQEAFYPSSQTYPQAYDPRMFQAQEAPSRHVLDPYALQRPEPSLYGYTPQSGAYADSAQSYAQPEMRAQIYEQYQSLPPRNDHSSQVMIDFSGSGLDDSSFGFSGHDSFSASEKAPSHKASEFLKSLQQGAKNKKMVIGVSLAALSALSLAVLNHHTQSEIDLAQGSERIPVLAAQNSGPSKVVAQRDDKNILGIDSALLNNEGADIDVEDQVIGRPMSSSLQPASAKAGIQLGQSVDLASIDKLAQILPKTEGIKKNGAAPVGVGGSLMMAEAKVSPKYSAQEKDLKQAANDANEEDSSNADSQIAHQQEGVQPFPSDGYIKYIDSKSDPRVALAQARAKNRDLAQLKVEGIYPNDAYIEEDAQRKPADDIVAISQDSNGAIPDFASVPPVAVGLVTSPYGIQLASLPTANAAKAYVETMRTKYPEILGSLASRVQRIKVADKVFYRVQFGPFNSSATAQDVCAKVGGTCLTIKGIDERKSPLKAVRG